ncbi:hypothetical protein UCDDS831_g07882 [Diplodia seriata]|uniref:BHLH domain-containing protein n=1 Tax=Diplodia seriata TaxID=420778 RepID=A0A0G2GD47_9PEZI|nr:hypothetical protein UCDDS831_g07882 [Diplodia seriata]
MYTGKCLRSSDQICADYFYTLHSLFPEQRPWTTGSEQSSPGVGDERNLTGAVPSSSASASNVQQQQPLALGCVVSSSSRIPHKDIERKYRGKLQTMFQQLRAVLTGAKVVVPAPPANPSAYAPPRTNPSKARVIELAIVYIRQLETERDCLNAACEHALEENARLRAARAVDSWVDGRR